MIARRVEYIRYCDVLDCCTSEAADWHTRKEAEAAAINDGWIKLTYNRWMCPQCKERAEERAAEGSAKAMLRTEI